MVEFKLMMNNLPEPVPENDIMDMFTFADKDKDGKISWEEFLVELMSSFNSVDYVWFNFNEFFILIKSGHEGIRQPRKLR